MNTNYILAAVSFIAGAAVGGAVSHFISKKRYERKLQEEVGGIWTELTVTADEADETHGAEPLPPVEKPDLAEYAERIREQSYTPPDLPITNDYIHEIGFHDLDEDEYERIDLVLYADGILADDADIPLKDPSVAVGENFLELMAGRDEILIRNEKRKIDYDITRSMLSYGELLDRHPETEQRLEYNNAMDEYYENSDEEEEDE